MAELALDDVQRHALPSHLDGMGVKTGTPEDDDQSSKPRPVDPRSGLPHDRDDLIDAGGSAG